MVGSEKYLQWKGIPDRLFICGVYLDQNRKYINKIFLDYNRSSELIFFISVEHAEYTDAGHLLRIA